MLKLEFITLFFFLLLFSRVNASVCTQGDQECLGKEGGTNCCTPDCVFVDFNHDGIVNIIDVSRVAREFGCKKVNETWKRENKECNQTLCESIDLDKNGWINVIDVSKVAKEFGSECPKPKTVRALGFIDLNLFFSIIIAILILVIILVFKHL